MSTRVLTLIAVALALCLAGCPQAREPAPSSLSSAIEAEMSAQDSTAADEEADYRRRVAVWMELDSDNDGLPNDIEMEYGLDADDPGDGYDIDGDGVPNFRDDDVDGDNVPNESDPDIDGDGVFNLLDIDIDGDAVLDDVDFDMDADEIRNEWDWDDDSDGEDDGDDDNDDDFGSIEDEELRFSAAIQALNEKLAAAAEVSDPALREKALKQYRGDLRDLLGQVSKVKHEKRPIPLAGKEMDLIAKSLACRFQRGGSKTMEFDIKGAITNLTPRHGKPVPDEPGTFTDPDATDAVEAVFSLLTEINDPGRKEAAGEATQRLDALVSLKSRLRQVETSACKDAVSKLVKMPGEASPEGRVEGVIQVWDVLEEPDLGTLVGDLDTMTRAFSTRSEGFAWDTMIDAVTKLEGMPGEASLTEKFDGVMRLWDVMDEPDLEELVNGLDELTKALESFLPGDFGWDVMIEALEGTTGIEQGIGTDQINQAMEEVAEVEGE